MKNLKKLSVVLFATLLSFNFTSCIEDGVSDAVDQVYLAQAEFLRAQAALKEADAQKALADAAFRDAESRYQDAMTANQEAMTQEFLDRTGETNAYNAQMNVMALAKFQAMLEVELVRQQRLLAVAQSAYEVAMVNLGEAVAEAKDELILNYYIDYAIVQGQLYGEEGLYQELIAAQDDKARKELFLINLGTEAAPDLVSHAFFLMQMEETLANAEATLAGKEASLAYYQSLTSDDASDSQKMVSDLEAEMKTVTETVAELKVEETEAEIAMDQAEEAWIAAGEQYLQLARVEGDLMVAKAALAWHETGIENADDAIADAAANIAAQPAADDAIAAVDTTTAYTGVMDAIAAVEAAEDALGYDWVANGAKPGYAAPPLSSYSANFPKTGTSAFDLLFNAQLEYGQLAGHANAMLNLMDPSSVDVEWGNDFYYFDGDSFPDLITKEIEYTAALSALEAITDGTFSGFTVAELDSIRNVRDAAELQATINWNADPTGQTVVDTNGNDDVDGVGDHSDQFGTSYALVTAWNETTPGSGLWNAGTIESTTLPAIADYYDASQTATVTVFVIDENNDIDELDVLDSTKAYYVEVEGDDDAVNNIDVLLITRQEAFTAEVNYRVANGEIAAVQEELDDALEDLEDAYAVFGLTFAYDGFVSMADAVAIVDIFNAKVDEANAAAAALGVDSHPHNTGGSDPHWSSAWHAVHVAQWDLQDANAALGNDFRAPDTKDWTDRFEEWLRASTNDDGDLSEATEITDGSYSSATTYERLFETINDDGDTEQVRDLPHYDGEHAWNSTPTAYEVLRNAYFEVMWAMEDRAELDTVWYRRAYDSNGDAESVDSKGRPNWQEFSNSKVVGYADADKAIHEMQLPTHQYAVDYLQGIFDGLLAEFGFDLDLWDFEDQMDVHEITEFLSDDLPLYAAYLDAEIAFNAVGALIEEQETIYSDLEQLRDAIALHLTDGEITNVGEFMEDVRDMITILNGNIDTAENAVENAKAALAVDAVDVELVNAQIAYCAQYIAELEVVIAGHESAAQSLLDRINALLN